MATPLFAMHGSAPPRLMAEYALYGTVAETAMMAALYVDAQADRRARRPAQVRTVGGLYLGRSLCAGDGDERCGLG